VNEILPPASDTLARLPLAEKVGLLSGDGPWHTRAVESMGLPAAELSDGPHGLRTETGIDMVWLPSTGFPTGSALGSSWDPDLARRVGRAIGEEARALGVQAVLGPGINMKRTPLCGRNFEYFSEDPALAAGLATAWVDGIQSTGVAACLKHFAANNQETHRTEISVEIDETTLRELYLEAFRRVITAASPWLVMCSYNRIGGVHASQHPWLLTTVLREEWGFDGVVVSDWDAVHDPVAAVRAGLDLEMPGTEGRSAAALLAAIESGTLDEETVDRAAGRVVRFVRRVLPEGRQADGPAVRAAGAGRGVPLSDAQLVDIDAAAHHQLAREAATASAVLLRNQRRSLPLDPDASQRIAVIGGYATTPRIQGGGSSGVAPTRVDQPLAAIRAIAGPDRVAYAQGYPTGWTNYYQEAEPVRDDAAALRSEAVRTAAAADVLIVFAGLRIADESEASDRHSLDLPADQVRLLVDLAALGKPMVVVLAAGSPVVLDPAWHDASAAVLLTHLGGQGAGTATAALLFGLANPSGRLAETWPVRLADTPGIETFPGSDGRVHYGEGIQIGYRWYDARGVDVAYPFGHGLSYTSFEYDSLVADASDDALEVGVRVSNTGARPGAEVLQLYVTPPPPPSPRRPRSLAGFAKAELAPGESRVVQVRVPLRDLSHWASDRGWLLTGGDWRVEAAASSRDTRVAASVHLGERGFGRDHREGSGPS
jgi:beta-glucosidase